MKRLKSFLKLVQTNKLTSFLILMIVMTAIIFYSLGRPSNIPSNNEKIEAINKAQEAALHKIDSANQVLEKIQLEQRYIQYNINKSLKAISNLEKQRNEEINSIRTLPLDGTVVFLSTRYDSISKNRLSKGSN